MTTSRGRGTVFGADIDITATRQKRNHGLSTCARNSETGGTGGKGASLEPARAATPKPATTMADAAITRRAIVLIIHLALASTDTVARTTARGLLTPRATPGGRSQEVPFG